MESSSFPTDICGVCALPSLNGKAAVVLGTLGGTVHVWDVPRQRSSAKLSGHATAPTVFAFDRANNLLISGGEDTKIKVWDLRAGSRQAMSTFKEHDGIITCLCLSADSRLLVSGAEDGVLKVWDMCTFKLSSTIKAGTREASYPLCVAFKHGNGGRVTGLTAGLRNKTVKHFVVNQNDSNNVNNWRFVQVCQTSIDNFPPRCIKYFNEVCFVAYDDCCKLFAFDEDGESSVKPHLLDRIDKPYGKVSDLKFSNDGS